MLACFIHISIDSASRSSSLLQPVSSHKPCPKMASSTTQNPSSSSSSAPNPNRSFDVFLSFRGEDTRYSFTDHLFVSLEGRGIHTFRDHKLERGEEIEQELLGTIEGSRFSIIVFSERYADSGWCLDELTKIMECRKEKGQMVLPVFYHVDPSDVRKQTGSFGKAFSKHETTVGEEKVERWRAAMTEATNIGGWHVIKDNEYESKPIKQIIDFILKRLKPKLLPIEEHIVGMKFRLKELKSLLQIHVDDIRVVGIYGIGGIGKTTIAKMVYNDLLCHFNGGSFLEDVKSRSKYHNDRLRLLQEILRDIQGNAKLELNNISDGVDMIKDRHNSEKCLIVIDDVDHWDQVQPLIKSCILFAPGSRIIITTRDKHLLHMCPSSEVKVLLYEAELLCDEEAIELFSWHAFKQNVPKEDYVNLSNCMVNYAQDHPLALKVLGSSLCGKTIDEWKSELDKLKKGPKKEINDLFRVCFDGLDHFEKEVFLDIACFFKGADKDFVLRILDSCNLYATCGMSVIHNRCLITIVDEKIQMHDLIQQMGWAIVREECPKDPSKWSRLWDPIDIVKAFSAKKMKSTETISLDLSRPKEMQFTSAVFGKTKNIFSKMKKLRLLKIYYSDHHSLTGKKDKICLPIDFEFPPNLRYLHWEGLEFLPSNFHGQNLVAINLKLSNIKELWEGDKHLENLKFIDLSDSTQLMKIPKLSSMPNLERLNLGGCRSIYELCSSIDTFPKMEFLKVLNFSGNRIKELPSIIGSLTSLEILDLSYCSQFEKFPDIFANMSHLRTLSLSESGIRELPNSIGYLESLETLQLSNCSNFKLFPEIHGNMKCLKNLSLDSTSIKELPDIIGCLGALEFLSLMNCSNLEKLPEFQRNMGRLIYLYASGTAIKELPSSIHHLTGLEDLFVENCAIKELPNAIGHLTGLTYLRVGNNDIKELPCSIGHLTQLQLLNLQGCKNLTSLPSSIYKLKTLKSCCLSDCSNLEGFLEFTEDMEYLEYLYLNGIGMKELPSSIKHLKDLELLTLSNCRNLETLPNSIGHLTQLHTLFLPNCPKLYKLPDSLRSLKFCLEELDISGCNLMEGAIPSDLWCLFSLVSLNMSGNNILRMPIGIIQLSQLKTLLMNHCPMLEAIPKLPSSLRRIEAHGCPCLEILSIDPTHLLWSYLLNCFKSQIQDFVKKTFFRYRNDLLRVCYETNIVIPGSCGIPEWVSHKNMGHEIIVELPKNWCENTNFLGFALFFHHVPLDDSTHPHDSFSHFCIPQLQFGISHGDQFEHMKTIWFEPQCKPYSVNGLGNGNFTTSSLDPALRVVYFPQISIERKYRSNGWNKFKALFVGPFECSGKAAFIVESCGIHFIYHYDAQDHHQQSHQLFNVKRGHHDTEDHPQHKKSRQV